MGPTQNSSKRRLCRETNKDVRGWGYSHYGIGGTVHCDPTKELRLRFQPAMLPATLTEPLKPQPQHRNFPFGLRRIEKYQEPLRVIEKH